MSLRTSLLEALTHLADAKAAAESLPNNKQLRDIRNSLITLIQKAVGIITPVVPPEEPVPPPPPPPLPEPEPEPEPQPDYGIIVDDRFVGGVKAAPQNGFRYTGASAGGSTTGDGVFVEDGALCFKFGGNPDLADDAWAEQNIELPDSEEFFFGYDIEPDANYEHRDGDGADNNKGLRIFGGPVIGATRDQAYNDGELGVGWSWMPSADVFSALMPEFETSEGTGNFRTGSIGSVLKPATLTRIGFYVKFGKKLLTTKLPDADGVIQSWYTALAGEATITVWVNGVRVYHRIDLPILKYIAYDKLFGYLMGWANSGFTKTTVVRLRRLVISRKPLPEYTS